MGCTTGFDRLDRELADAARRMLPHAKFMARLTRCTDVFETAVTTNEWKSFSPAVMPDSAVVAPPVADLAIADIGMYVRLHRRKDPTLPVEVEEVDEAVGPIPAHLQAMMGDVDLDGDNDENNDNNDDDVAPGAVDADLDNDGMYVVPGAAGGGDGSEDGMFPAMLGDDDSNDGVLDDEDAMAPFLAQVPVQGEQGDEYVVVWEGLLPFEHQPAAELSDEMFHLAAADIITPETMDWPAMWSALERDPPHEHGAELDSVFLDLRVTMVLFRPSDKTVATFGLVATGKADGPYMEPDEAGNLVVGRTTCFGNSGLTDDPDFDNGQMVLTNMDIKTVHSAEDPKIASFTFSLGDQDQFEGQNQDQLSLLSQLPWVEAKSIV